MWFTYLLKSGQYYKVGKTKDLNRRLAEYRTHNPSFRVIGVIEGDFEKQYLKAFKACGCHKAKGRNEWFSVPRKVRKILNDRGLGFTDPWRWN